MQKQIAEIMLSQVQNLTLDRMLDQMHKLQAECLALKMNLRIHVNNKKGLLIDNSLFLLFLIS